MLRFSDEEEIGYLPVEDDPVVVSFEGGTRSAEIEEIGEV